MNISLALSRVRKRTICFSTVAIAVAVADHVMRHKSLELLLIVYLAVTTLLIWALFGKAYADWRIKRHPISRLQDFEVRRLARLHPDVKVSMPDSVSSGNCFSGSLQFTKTYFPDRASVTLGELLGVASKDGRVMRVIKYKLTKIRGLRIEEARSASEFTEVSSNAGS
jgi:hypothetical protein